MKTQLFLFTLLLSCTLAYSKNDKVIEKLNKNNDIWNSPSKGSEGSMPLGNGDIGLNVWVEEGGDLMFYISKTDAFSGIGRLLKLGRIRVKLTPNPFLKGQEFKQELDLKNGEILIMAGNNPIKIRLWVDANNPVIRIDAVIIATPDHTHFPATMVAMELGKHVFVEKPLAHNIWQVRTMKKAAKYYGVISQMGNQGHTTNGIRLIKEWYDAGVLGQVKEVYAWIKGFDPTASTYPPPKQPVPSYLDWDLWLGPAAYRDYSPAYCPGLWRLHYDFGNGQLGDWACHSLDGPFWALDLGMPHTVEASVENPVPDHRYISKKSVVKYQFGARGDKAPVKLTYSESTLPDMDPREVGLEKWPKGGVVMIGEKNSLYTGMRPNNPRLILPEEEWEAFKKNALEQTIPRIGDETPVKGWVDAIKGDYLPGSNFDYAADLTEMALLGVMATRFNTRLEYDAENMMVTNRPDLDAYIKEPMRSGFSYGENI